MEKQTSIPTYGPVATTRPVWVVTLLGFLGLFFVAFDSTLPNVTLPVVLKDLHMSVGLGGVAVTVSFVGTCLMFVASGTLMDRWGRKQTFLLVLLGTAIFSGVTAFVFAPWQWMLIRFFAGASLAVIGIVAVLVSEVASATNRGMMIGIVQAAYPAGAIVASALSSRFLSAGVWRPLYLFAFIPVLIVIAAAWVWLGDSARSKLVARVKQRKGSVVEETPSVAIHEVVDPEKARKLEWRQVFAKDLRRQTIVTSAFAFLVAFGTQVLVAYSVIYLTLYDHLPVGIAALALTAESVATLVGQFGSGWLADYISPRTVLIIFASLGAVGISLLAVPGDVHWILLPMVVGGLFGQGLLGCLPRYASDSFPTRTRGVGTQLVTGMHFLAPIFTGTVYGLLLETHNVIWVPILAAVVTALGAVTLFFGRSIPPKRELEQIAV